MIYTLTLNPSLDYLIEVDGFQEDSLNRTSRERIVPGGKGINVSLVLKELSFESVILGYKAGFTGEEIERRLREEGMKTDLIEVKEGLSRINVKMRSQGETEINGLGPVITEEDVERLLEKIDECQKDDVLVLSGSVPSCLPKEIYVTIMKRLEGKGVRIIVDTSGKALLHTLEYHPFLIKPNDREAGEILDTAVITKEEALSCARKLQELGAENILLSMGGKGAVFLDEEGNEYQCDGFCSTVKNSIGAGDSMLAGFLAEYLNSHDYERAFRKAVAAGCASAFSDDLATREEIDTLFERISSYKS